MKKTRTSVLAFILVLFLSLPPSGVYATDTNLSSSSQTQQQQDSAASTEQAQNAETATQPESTDETGLTSSASPEPDETGETEETTAPTDDDTSDTEDAPDDNPDLETPEAPANQRPTPLPAGRYRIRPAVSDIRLLDIDKASAASGANLQIYQSNNGQNQFFDVSYDAEGFYTIKNVRSGKVLDIAWGQATRGANVIQYAPHGRNNQKWVITESRDARNNSVYMLASALAENIVLDINGGVDANLTNVQVWPKHNGPSQKFYFMPLDAGVVSTKTIDDGIYTLTSALSDKFALDIAGAATTNGLQLQLWQYNGGLAQLFEIKCQSDGFYTIRPLGSGKTLDVSGNHVVATTPVLQWSSNGGDNQRWAIADNEDGTFSFIAKNSGLVLDVAGAKAASGTKLLMYYRHNNANQRFKLKLAAVDPLQQGIFSLLPFSDMSKAIDIEGASYSSGAKALAYKSHGGMNQKFLITRIDTATYAFSSLVSGMYLTADSGNVYQAAGSDGSPTAAQQWIASWGVGGIHLVNASTGQAMVMSSDGKSIKTAAPNGALSQAFRFQEVAPLSAGYYTIKSASGYALDLNGGNVASGTNIQLYAPSTSAAQIWKLDLSSNGYYTISNARSGKCVDIQGGSKTEGTNVLAWDKNGAAWQKWKPIPSGDGWFYLQSASGMYLSVSGEGNYNKANVFASTSITKTAQKFRFTASSYTGYFGTYADVNLTTQKMIYVKDGVLVLESDIVTGAPSMRTPTGTFKIIGKSSPAVLRGPGYASPVTYWMPFTNSGVGFHDATWQSRFGGDWYVSHGSHGCINMPLSAAKTLYGVISTGDTVKVHY
ncbi:MAG: RICIN domain-containing protein [Coriobacteriales bacterium]|jgi:lipoprotein-anchoring transpeptidase ErfK/SrfK|nr:RICIN domain-containing protein [Coriobacteriales bacterium]